MNTFFRRVALGGVVAMAGAVLAAPPVVASESSPQEATPQQEAAAMARPAIVSLTVEWQGWVRLSDGTLLSNDPWEYSSSCTGFVVNPDGYVATAGHCVDDTSATGAGREILVSAALDAAETTGLSEEQMVDTALAGWTVEGAEANSPVSREVSVITGSGTGNDLEGEALPAQVVEFKSIEEGDVALLKIQETNLPAIELASDAAVAQGTEVLSIGFPGSTDEITDPSLEPTFKDGQISSETTVGSVPVYETSAALSEGMSGGPTVGMDGEVIGINSFKPGAEEQAFNYIAPASTLNEMLGRNNVTAQLGSSDETYREGLTDYFSGSYSDAIEKFDQVLGVSPDHAQAEEYKTLATQARARYGEPGLGVLPFLVGGAVLLVAVCAVGALLLVRRGRRRRGTGGPTPPTPGGPRFPATQHPAAQGPAFAPPVAQSPPAQPPVAQPPMAPVPMTPIPVTSLPERPEPAQPIGFTAPSAEVGPPSAPPPAPDRGPATVAGPGTFPPPAPAAGRFCSGCGVPREGAARFCPSCGSPQR